MKYTIIKVSYFSLTNIEKLKAQINGGFFCVYCQKSNSLFYGGHAKAKAITNFERSVALEALPELTFSVLLQDDEQRSIRREDFKIFLKALRAKDVYKDNRYVFRILPDRVVLKRKLSANDIIFPFLFKDDSRHWQLVETFYELLSKASLSDRRGDNGKGETKNSQAKLSHLLAVVERNKHYARLKDFLRYGVLDKKFVQPHIYLQSSSFKEMIFYRSIFMRDKKNVRFSYALSKNFFQDYSQEKNYLQNFPTSFYPKAYERVVYIVSRSSMKNEDIFDYVDIFSNSYIGKDVLFLEGDYHKTKWNMLLNNMAPYLKNALLIYQGNSAVINGRIFWQARDGMFAAPIGSARYLHLSCMHLKKQENILYFPAHKNFLPIISLPNTNYRPQLLNMFSLINNENDFLFSAEKAFEEIHTNHIPLFVSVRTA